MAFYALLLLAVNTDGPANKVSGTFAVLVDIGRKTLVHHIHLSQTSKNLPGTGVEVIRNVDLQFCGQRLSLFGFCVMSLFHTQSKFAKNSIQTFFRILPPIFRVILRLLSVLLPGIGFTPSFFCFRLVFFKLSVIKCFHHIFSFHGAVYGRNQPFHPFFFQYQKVFLLSQGLILVIVCG